MKRLWHLLFGKLEICPECGIKTKELSYHLLMECPVNLEYLRAKWIEEMKSSFK